MKQFYIKNDALGCFLAPKIDVALMMMRLLRATQTKRRVAFFFSKVLRSALSVICDTKLILIEFI